MADGFVRAPHNTGYGTVAPFPLWTAQIRLFLALQLADVVSTMAFRSIGVAESNPLIGMMMDRFGTLAALLIVKFLAISIALACNAADHPRFVRLVNMVYATIVSLNFLTICYALHR